MRIAAPANPVQPVLDVLTGHAVSSCGSWRFDFSSAFGSAGRVWRNVTFEVVGEVLASNTTLFVRERVAQAVR